MQIYTASRVTMMCPESVCVCLGSGNGWVTAVLVGGCLFRSQGTSWYSSRSQEGLWLPRPAHRDHRSSSVGGTKPSLFSLNSWTHIQKQFLGVFLSMIFCFHSFAEVIIILLFAPGESSNIITSPCHIPLLSQFFKCLNSILLYRWHHLATQVPSHLKAFAPAMSF